MGTAHRYDLYVAFGISIEGVSVQQDSSVARNRIVGSASWTLRAQDPTRSTLTTGNARSIDGVDIVNEQFFAADLNTETAQKRVCEALADQITLQLAAYFLRAS
jgi:LPS-assembly lipoprotein